MRKLWIVSAFFGLMLGACSSTKSGSVQSGSSVGSGKYQMTIIAGRGAVLDVAFQALGCAAVCQDVTLACHCYKNVSDQVTYAFSHGTSGQNAVVDVYDENGHSCGQAQYNPKREDGSSHDTWCITCVNGKSRMHNPTCLDPESGTE
jgi:hypothetical protein